MKNGRRFINILMKAALFVSATVLCVQQAHSNNTVTVFSNSLLSMDPAFTRTPQDLSIMSQIYSSLTVPSFATGELMGNLATEWSDVDGKVFTFKLVKGAKFANGEPLDAAAVVWNFERLKNPDTKAAVIADFDLIESVDRKSVV